MSSQVKPYGQQEVDQEVPRGLIGADDSLAYKKEKKTVVISNTQQDELPLEATSTPQEALSPEEHNEKYKKTDWKKRHDDLKRHHDRKINTMKSEVEELRQQIASNRPKFSPPKTPEEMATFRAENPDIYDMVESIAHMRTSEETEQLKSTVDKLSEELRMQQQARALAELNTLAPDYSQIAGSEDFKLWANDQPTEIQNWIFNNPDNAQLAAKAINLYKADRGMQNVRPPASVGNAADAVTLGRAGEPQDKSNGRLFTTTELANMSWKEYDKLRDEIDQAHREGRVVKG